MNSSLDRRRPARKREWWQCHLAEDKILCKQRRSLVRAGRRTWSAKTGSQKLHSSTIHNRTLGPVQGMPSGVRVVMCPVAPPGPAGAAATSPTPPAYHLSTRRMQNQKSPNAKMRTISSCVCVSTSARLRFAATTRRMTAARASSATTMLATKSSRGGRRLTPRCAASTASAAASLVSGAIEFGYATLMQMPGAPTPRERRRWLRNSVEGMVSKVQCRDEGHRQSTANESSILGGHACGAWRAVQPCVSHFVTRRESKQHAATVRYIQGESETA